MPRQIPRRTLIVGSLAALSGLLAAAGLVGCGGPGAGADALTGSGTGGDADPAGTRTVQAATGAVTVPDDPRRVVVLDTAELDTALTLGITPVGAARAALDSGLPGYWDAARVAAVAPVGLIGDPDLGAVASLRPDLILSNRSRDGDRYDSLALIAPTVLTEDSGYAWKQNVGVHARALDRQAAADLVAAGYLQHVDQAAEALGGRDHLARQRISLLRFVEGEPPRLYATRNFLGVVLADLGFGRPDSQSARTAFVPLRSTAQLAAVDGSVIFYSSYGDPARAGATAVLASAAWRSLRAVANRQAFAVDDELWFQGIGYTGANLVVSQVQKFLQS